MQRKINIRYITGVFLFLIFMFTVTIWSFAQGLSNDLFEDPSTKAICYRSVETDTDEEIGYKVLGFTMHQQDDFGEEVTNPYVTLRLNDEGNTVTEGGNTVKIRKLDTGNINDKLLQADPTGAWLNEWNSAKRGSLYFNAIITTYTRKKDASGRYVETVDGSLNADGSYTGKVYDFGSGKTSTDGIPAGTLKDLLQKHSWSGITSSGMNGLFHIMYTRNTGLPDAGNGEDGDTVENLTVSGSDSPELYTWHTSNDYNVGEGIPSGCTMTNGILASRYYGTYAYEKTKTKTRTYYITYVVKGKQYVTEHVRGVTGEYEDKSYWKSWTVYVPVTVQRSASYYALRSVGLYELKNVAVYNGAYDVVQYDVAPSTESLDTNTDIKINGEAPAAFKDIYATDPEKHILWPAETEGETITVEGNHAPMTEAEAKASLNIQERAETKVGNVSSWNDTLVINGTVYMNGTPVSGRNTVDLMPEPSKLDSNFNTSSFVSDSKDVGIPVSRANGKYETTVNAQYERIYPEDHVLKTAEKKGTSAIIKNSKLSLVNASIRPAENMDKNEPVVVHTPVVSPVTFHDSNTAVTLNADNSKTQLAVPAADAWNRKLYDDGITGYNLLLDNTYTLQFDPYQWISEDTRSPLNMQEESITVGNKTGYDISNGQTNDYKESTYDKYVAKRVVRFPFDIAVVQDGTGELIYYTANVRDENSNTLYTDWITLSSNSANFYIPTWAKESSAVFGKGNQNKYYEVQFKVYARNAGGHEDSEEDTMNSELNNHVATFNVPVNISGSVYDFRVLGITDKDMYYGYNKSGKDANAVLFKNNEEKVAGSKDRLGKTSVRNISDDTIRKSVTDKDILPLHNGSSLKYSEMGALWRGTTFSFSLKTLGGYSDDTSKIRITPSYRYYDKNGVERDALILYSRSDSNGNEQYIPYGSSRDTLYGTTSLSNTLLKGAWNSDAFLFTKTFKGISEQSILNKDSTNYSLSLIELTEAERLYTGSLYDLSINSGKDDTAPDFFGHLGTASENGTIKVFKEYADDEDDSTKRNAVFMDANLLDGNTAAGRQFRSSMQTWYGLYTIPENLYVTTTDALNAAGYSSFEDYAKSGKLSRNSDIWMKDGYLMLHFDISVYKNDIEQLKYDNSSNSGLDMWAQQGELTKLNLMSQVREDAGNDENLEKGSYKNNEVNVHSGDVALIDLRYGLRDKMEAGLYMTNR